MMDDQDWDPTSPSVLENQIAAYDRMRRSCPVAHSRYFHWSLFRHADVMRALQEPNLFSNAVSRHVSVPNGMDPPAHTGYRRVTEAYFSPERMEVFEPACRAIAAGLTGQLLHSRETELMAKLAQPYAIQVQCSFLDWPSDLHEPLLQWTHRNHAATRAGDRATMAAVALEFDGYIRDILAEHRRGAAANDDVVSRLLLERVHGKPLSDEELVSILRNWTVGELSTIAASVGILAHFLASRQDVQQQLREKPELLPAAIDEILRIHAPLIASRRVTTGPAEIGGRHLTGGERVTLIWASANRDEEVFGDPDEFRLDRPGSANLLYGAGIHVCPGAPLARLELRILMEELLARTRSLELIGGKEPKRASYPASGFSTVPLRLA